MTEGPGWAAPDPQQPQQPPQQPPAYQSAPPPPPPPPQYGWSGGGYVPKPGVIPLRPLRLSEILDGAISTMRAHPKVVLGVSALVVTVTQLISLAATYPFLDDLNRAVNLDDNATDEEVLSALGSSFGALGIGFLITLLSVVFLSGFLTVAVGKAVLGQPVAFSDIWVRVRARFPALLGMTLLFPAVALVLFGILLLLILAAGPGILILLLVIIPVGFWLYIRFSLATPALMLENAGVFKAFGRSWTLVRGSWWRMFGIQLLAWLIAAIVGGIIGAPFDLIGGGFDLNAVEITFSYLALTTIGAIIANTITVPFTAGVTVLLYTDQRMRREGMDIELAKQAGLPSA
jgi:hypothetical protein